MGWLAVVRRSRALRVVVACTYLYPPALVAYVAITTFESPSGPGWAFTLALVAFFLFFCWFGFR